MTAYWTVQLVNALILVGFTAVLVWRYKRRTDRLVHEITAGSAAVAGREPTTGELPAVRAIRIRAEIDRLTQELQTVEGRATSA